MAEMSMKEKLAAGHLVLCMNLRLARSVARGGLNRGFRFP